MSASTDPEPDPNSDGRWLKRAAIRSRIVDANDGIIATAGIVEGFASAGAGDSTMVVAAFAAMVAGGLSMGGARFAEAAVERDAQTAAIEAERRRLDLLPDEELAELAFAYEAKGLSPELARQVAEELTSRDALAAHIDEEYGLEAGESVTRPVITALSAALAFALGSAIPMLAILFTPDSVRIPVTFAAVVLSLCITSAIAARSGRVGVRRTILRTVTIGVVTMLLTLAGGSLIDL